MTLTASFVILSHLYDKSVLSCCEIDVLVAFCVFTLFFFFLDFFVGVEAFVMGMSQISSFFIPIFLLLYEIGLCVPRERIMDVIVTPKHVILTIPVTHLPPPHSKK